MISAMTSFFTSVKLIKKLEVKEISQKIDQIGIDEIIHLLKDSDIDQIGYTMIDESDVFKYLAVPYKHVIIFTARQDKDEILTSPSMKSQIEVGRIYGKTGRAANKLTKYLTDKGYGAMPSHSLGGVIDYTKLGSRAGLGVIGNHGLLIEPISGPNHRLGAVFTNIENLDDYFEQTTDYEWVKDFCTKCGKCRRKCPGDAIKAHTTINENGYITSIDYKKCEKYFSEQFGCNICVAECPFTTVGYDKIKSGYMKQLEKVNNQSE